VNDVQPILYDNRQAAQACGVSLSLWKMLVNSGQTPAPCRLNSKVVFSVKLLELWAQAGCPNRDSGTWKQILKEGFNSDGR
jgi:hypothetical protein